MNNKKVADLLDQQYKWKEFKDVVVGDKVLDYIDHSNDSLKFFDVEVLRIVDNDIKCSKSSAVVKGIHFIRHFYQKNQHMLVKK